MFSNPWPAFVVCLLVPQGLLVAGLIYDRSAGEAIFLDRVVVGASGFGWHQAILPYSDVTLIEKGCLRSRNRDGLVYNIVFDGGERITLAPDVAREFGRSREEWLRVVEQVDSSPALVDVPRSIRHPANGGPLDDKACLASAITAMPEELRQRAFAVYGF
jgi:hypothetical protein